MGAVVLALLPDRGKTMQWGALIVTLITFLLTLHLPSHYQDGLPAGTFQFAVDLPGSPLRSFATTSAWTACRCGSSC